MIDVHLLLVYSAPIILAALGEIVVQRAGLINIGLEGMMLLAAFFGMLVAHQSGSAGWGMVAAMGVGLASAAASAVFTVNLGADQVVVGTALDLLAIGLTGTLFRAQFGESGMLLSLPKLPAIAGIDPVLVAMVLSVPLIRLLLMHTGWGLAARSAGEYPKATEGAGFSVTRLRFEASLVGGLFAGLAGGYLSIGVAGSFAENMTNGRGFIAIAIVTFGRWRPLYVFLAGLMIGFFDTLQFVLQARGVQAPSQLLIALPYVVALLVLVLAGRGTMAPASLGVPYRRSK